MSGLGGQVCVDFLANTSAMRVGQVPLRLCACSQGYHGVLLGEGLLVNVRLSLSTASSTRTVGGSTPTQPTAVNPLPFEFVLATAERVVVDTYGKHLRT